jgi:DNA (cytosine-5)-methyltransferase 1
MANFRLGELFCGPGGLAYGAMTAKIEKETYKIIHAWSSDYDSSTCDTYRLNICSDAPDTVICADVRTMDLSKKNKSLTPIDAFAFGFPCNDFSQVGEQKGIHGHFGPLYQYGIKILKEFQPKWFLAENVGGLQSANEGKTFFKVLDDMRATGYRVYPHLYKFEEYGIPQARHRVIIIGIRQDLPFEYRPPSTAPYKSKDNTCKTAIEHPPIPKDAPNNELTRQSPVVVERLKHIKPGQNAFNANLPDELKLNVKGAKISQIYRRLDPKRPAYTVTGSGGGGTHIYHYKEPRALTNRERARLQTFPDTYEFLGSKEQVRKQIGMAVPCDGARIIFEAVLRTFAGIEYESVDCNIKQ